MPAYGLSKPPEKKMQMRQRPVKEEEKKSDSGSKYRDCNFDISPNRVPPQRENPDIEKANFAEVSDLDSEGLNLKSSLSKLPRMISKRGESD